MLKLPALHSSVREQLFSNEPSTVHEPEPDFMAGGKWLVDATIKYGVNDQGDRLRITPGLLELLELLGDFRISGTYTSGAAQVYKSVAVWQLMAALITVGRRDFAMVFPQMSIIQKIVPSQFKRIVSKWEQSLGLEKKANNSDSKSITIHQSVLGTGRFSPAIVNTESKEAGGLARANANNVGYRVDILGCDEKSQCDSKSLDSIRRRTLQSRIATRPERFSGTPGSGGGIEMEIQKADYEFHAYIECSHCREIIKLSPIGCLLKPNLDGEYFDNAGRPVDWHRSDESEPISSAYFGCPSCSGEISKGSRLAATFRCARTGVTLRSLLDSLPYGIPPTPITAGVILSPLLRDTGHNPAVEIVTKGLYGADVVDWHQQELGIPTKHSNTGITIEMIRSAIATPIPNEPIEKRVWGLDQGTTEHWLCIINYRLPAITFGLSNIQIYEQSHREIVAMTAVNSNSLDQWIDGCDGGALDNEPGREYASRVIKEFDNCFAFDQRGGKQMGGRIAKKGIVEAGGVDLDVLLCDTHRLQDMIMAAFTSGSVSLPSWIDPLDMRSSAPSRHLTTSRRNSETGVWARPSDHKDDLLKALMGCELWWYLEITGRGLSSGTSLGDLIY